LNSVASCVGVRHHCCCRAIRVGDSFNVVSCRSSVGRGDGDSGGGGGGGGGDGGGDGRQRRPHQQRLLDYCFFS
jgi:hypothetical protein